MPRTFFNRLCDKIHITYPGYGEWTNASVWYLGFDRNERKGMSLRRSAAGVATSRRARRWQVAAWSSRASGQMRWQAASSPRASGRCCRLSGRLACKTVEASSSWATGRRQVVARGRMRWSGNNSGTTEVSACRAGRDSGKAAYGCGDCACTWWFRVLFR
jgi:hypothetical protein